MKIAKILIIDLLMVVILATLAFCGLQEPQITPEENSIQTDTIEPPAAEPEPEPFIRYPLTDSERSYIERVVMAEAGNQPLEGQIAVAQCILNSAEATGVGPINIVTAPKQYAAPADASIVTDSVKQAVAAVFDQGLTVTEEDIRYFYAPKYSSGSWHEASLEHVITIADHKFFKLSE